MRCEKSDQGYLQIVLEAQYRLQCKLWHSRGKGAQVVQTLGVVRHVGRCAAIGDPTLDVRTQTATLATNQQNRLSSEDM